MDRSKRCVVHTTSLNLDLNLEESNASTENSLPWEHGVLIYKYETASEYLNYRHAPICFTLQG